MASGLFNSKAFQTIMLIAVLLVLAGIPFMLSVATELRTAAVTVSSVLTLIVLIDALMSVGKRK